MKLSIVIVNYKVKYFLEACLQSLRKATANIEAEVFVVDNASNDGSVEWVQERFPEVKLIANAKNVGFSAANNQAIREAKGEYILLLNPDTIVGEHSFTEPLDFMDAHPEAGGLGIKMLDGQGQYLPESKRGFPKPSTAFYKLSGLNKLFSKSARFNHYYLGHLSENQIQEAEVLAGAYMLLRKETLDKIGLLDDTFFMYGEDIDLSWRIIQGGYKNIYFSENPIIHYKGESTKKATFNYVKLFYQAMIIFAKKHFKGAFSASFILFLQLAIYLRAMLSLFSQIGAKLSPFLFDALLSVTGVWSAQWLWLHRSADIPEHYYPSTYTYFVLPIYALVWVVSLYFNGAYDKQFKWRYLGRGLLLGTVIISAVYAFLPKELQFSRAIILLGASLNGLCFWGWRRLAVRMNPASNFRESEEKRMLFVGEIAEVARVQKMIQDLHIPHTVLGTIRGSDKLESAPDEAYVGSLRDLKKLVLTLQVNEVLFCLKDVQVEEMITAMAELKGICSFKVLAENGTAIVGSNSKETAGDTYLWDQRFSLHNTFAKRNKRLFDVLFSVVILSCFFVPIFAIVLWDQQQRTKLWRGVWTVIQGRVTWFGTLADQRTLLKEEGLQLNEGVFPVWNSSFAPQEAWLVRRLLKEYVQNYRVKLDFRLAKALILARFYPKFEKK